MTKKKSKIDLLAKLGAPPLKQQKKPFKMSMGILASEAKKAKKAIQESRESDIVLPKMAKKKKSSSKREADAGHLVGIKGNVLNMNRGRSNREFVAGLKHTKKTK